MKTIDRTVYDLCEEIDSLREAVAYWEGMYKEERDRNTKDMNERFEETKKGVAGALMFALAVKDDKDGNLIIAKEDREMLAEYYR